MPALSFSQTANNPDINILTVNKLGPNAGPNAIASTNADGSTITIVTTAGQFAANAAANPAAIDFLNVATHEIGHALGLLHATTPSSIMFPITGNQEALGRDDTAAIKALYGWAPQNKLQGGTEQAPALCACGNTLAMAWRGSGNDHNIWISTKTNGDDWTPQRPLRDVGTIGSPALAWDGRKLWLVWRGTGDDQGLYFKTTTDFFQHDNPGQQKIPNVGSSHGPRIAIIGGTPTVVWKGVNDDHRIFITRFVGGWQGQSVVPNVGTSAAPAICQDIDGGARLLWRGINDDQVLWTTASSPGSVPIWQPQQKLTWTVTGNGTVGTISTGTAGSAGGPSLVLVGNVVQAAWRGINGDQGLWFTQLAKDVVSGGTVVNEWSNQANVPNTGSSDGPSIANFQGKLHMVWKGVKDDTGLYHSSL